MEFISFIFSTKGKGRRRDLPTLRLPHRGGEGGGGSKDGPSPLSRKEGKEKD